MTLSISQSLDLLPTTDADVTHAPSSEFLRGVRAAMPILFAVSVCGLIFGAQATQKGLSFVEIPLMTGANFAGGSEFAAIGLWASPPPLLLIAAVTLLINSRHIVMGAALTPHIRHLPRWQAALLLFLMADETWALSYSDTLKRAADTRAADTRISDTCVVDARAAKTRGPSFSIGYYLGVGLAIYGSWLGTTALGACLGPILGNATSYGFDMAFPAIFLVLIAGMWKGYRDARPWIVSFASASLTAWLLPGAWYVVTGVLAGLGGAYVWSRQP